MCDVLARHARNRMRDKPRKETSTFEHFRSIPPASHSLPCLATRIAAHHSCHASHRALDKGAPPIAIAGSPAIARDVECEPARRAHACLPARDARVMRTCVAHARAPEHSPRDVSSRHVPCLASILRPHLAKPLSIPVHLTAQTSPSQDLSHTPTPYGYGVWEIRTSRHTLVKLDMPNGRIRKRARARRAGITAGQRPDQLAGWHLPHPA